MVRAVIRPPPAPPRRLLAVAALAAALLAAPPAVASPERALAVRIEGVISPVTAEALAAAIAR